MAEIIRQFKVLSLPIKGVHDAIYFVKTGPNTVAQYVTDTNGEYNLVDGSGSSSSIKENESLIGIKDKVNFEFTTPTSFILRSTKIYLNGQRLMLGPGNDYIEIPPNKIDFILPPYPTDQIIIDYRQ